MTVWQRRLRFAVAVFGLALSVVVFLAIRKREPPPPPIKPDKTDGKAISEVGKGHFKSTKGAKTDFTIDFDRQFTYADNSVRFVGVTVSVSERGGRSFVLTARDGQVGPDQAWVTVSGNVKLAVSDGLTAETDVASYTASESVVRAPGRVAFARGRMKGSGLGMTYDKVRDVLWLLDQAEVTIEPDEAGHGTLDITAGAAGFARPDKYMKFERHVKMLRDGRIIEADDATAHLSDDEKHVTAIELHGNARITPQPGGPGSVQQLHAAEMTLAYAPDSETLEHATLAGRSVVQLAGERGGRGSRIAAEALDVGLGPDGATLTTLVARDNVQTDFAATRGQPTRTVRSVSLDGRGEPGKGLTAATFTDNVEYRETIPGRPPVVRTVRAKVLEAVLDPATAAIEEGRFSGAVRFEEGKMSATAAIARYSVEAGTVDLSGLEDTLRPMVEDERIRIEARSIQLTPEGHRMTATQDVRSTMQPAKKPPAASGGEPQAAAETRMPGMLTDDEPVSITGDHLEYDGAKSHAVYTGGARLWQGDTSIYGDSLTLDNETGNLVAVGSVRSVWTAETTAAAPPKAAAGRGAGAPPPAPKPGDRPARTQTLASAGEMHYDDARRLVTYKGTAHVVGTQGDVTAARIELNLKKDSNDLDRVEAYDTVTVKIDKRVSTGSRMTYFAADERYLMRGDSVKVAECGNEHRGRVVTFYKSTDTIQIDGVSSRMASMQSGTKCP